MEINDHRETGDQSVIGRIPGVPCQKNCSEISDKIIFSTLFDILFRSQNKETTWSFIIPITLNTYSLASVSEGETYSSFILLSYSLSLSF